jgi:hypothetical protein
MTRPLLAFALVCAILYSVVYRWASMPAYEPLSDGERASALSAVRATLAHPGPPASGAGTFGPVRVALYDKGEPVAVAVARGTSLADALRAATQKLIAPAEVAARARVKIDIMVARAPIVASPSALLALSLVPGIDGLGVDLGGQEIYLWPDDLRRAESYAANQPFPGLEVTVGLDVQSVLRKLAVQGRVSGEVWRRTPKRWFRFRAHEIIEAAAHDGRALAVVRGNVAGPKVSRAALLAAAEQGGRYLLRHLDENGRFDYEYHTAVDQNRPGEYAIPRHAGATYFLAQLAGATHDQSFADGAKRALGWLERESPPACAARGCVGTQHATDVDLGSTALSLAAASEYEKSTGDTSFHAWAARMDGFVRRMQRPSGDFRHLYQPAADRADEEARLLYYSGEAAFALARFAALAKHSGATPRNDALDAALAAVTGGDPSSVYAHFAGRFFYMEDHWTCMAVEAGWEQLPPGPRRDGYARFCDGFARFLQRTQYRAGESLVAALPDLEGAYGFSPVLAPHATPVGSRSETAISIWQLGKRRGLTDVELAPLRNQIQSGMRFLLEHQIDRDGAWLMSDPESARGGLLMSDVNRYVRIDFVQHACSAMLRATDVLN